MFTSTATCAAGKTLVGGGIRIQQTGSDTAHVQSSYPSAALTWTASAIVHDQNNGGSLSVTAYAYCA